MKNLDKKSVWLFFFNFVFRGLFLLIFIGIWSLSFIGQTAGTIDALPGLILVVIIIYLAFCYLWAKLSYHFYKYELTDNGFRKESGILYKKYVTIPYDRIQNIDINRGILAQLLGLSSLNIQTAGSSAVMARNSIMFGMGAEGQLPGLSKEIAILVRDELIERTKKNHQSFKEL